MKEKMYLVLSLLNKGQLHLYTLEDEMFRSIHFLEDKDVIECLDLLYSRKWIEDVFSGEFPQITITDKGKIALNSLEQSA